MSGDRAVRVALGRLLHRDPCLLVLCVGLFAGLNGFSLVMPGDSFALNPIFGEIRKLGWSEERWGTALMLISAGLDVTAFRGPALVRAFVAAIAAAFFVLWGVLLLIGGAKVGLFTGGGAYSLACALLLTIVPAQWANTMAPVLPGAFGQEAAPWK